MTTPIAALIPVHAVVNGRSCNFAVSPDESAVEAIRQRLGLTGPKLSCGQGACGACTVMVDGTPVAACIMPATSLEGRTVRTVEDLDNAGLHPVQRAFLAEDALQCGYCTPGFVIEAAAFCDRWRAEHGSAVPDRATIAAALAGHLCRCGAYEAIYAAVAKACGGEFDDNHSAPMPRRDGLEKVTGRAQYTVDVRYDGLLEGRILRSPHAHARITKLDWSRAERLPGVAAVVRMTTQSGLLRYAGQEILAIAAVDRATAEHALSLVDIEMEILPAVIDMDAARADGAPLVYSERRDRREAPNAAEGAPLPSGWNGNLRGPFTFFSTRSGKARDAIERAQQTSGCHVASGTWRVQTQCHNTLEPHACVAAWDAGGGLTVHVSTQSLAHVAKDIALHWKLKEEKVRVLAPYVGGGFGSKVGLGPEVRAAVDLAKAARAPVRIVLDRREELAVGGLRPAHELQLAVATDADGRLAGMRLKAYGNAGVAIGNSAGFLYRIMYSQAPKELLDWDVTTHTPPGKPFRGPGGPPALWALEQTIDAIAAARDEDPIALRQRWDQSEVRQRLYTWARALPVWAARGPVAQDRGRFRRGVGVAGAAWLYFTNPATRVRVDTSPNGIVASTACQDMGNGTRSVIADAVAGVFGIDASRVDVRVGDSRYVEGPMSSGSRTTASVVPCAEDAALWIRDRLVKVAVHRLGCGNARPVPGGIVHDGGFMSWDEVFRVAEPLSYEGQRKRDRGGYFLPFRFDGLAIGKYLSGAVQVSEVEVDTRLGRVRVLETWAGIGVGRIVSPALARSQAQGGLIQGISYALYEERRLDPTSGALLTGSLDDYRIAGIGDIGPLHIHFDQDGFENAQGRAVGLGEIVTMAPAASIGNAVYHATGWRPSELPLRPDRVLAGVK